MNTPQDPTQPQPSSQTLLQTQTPTQNQTPLQSHSKSAFSLQHAQDLEGRLRVISAGAAQSLVQSLAQIINSPMSPPRLELKANFGAVGAMVDLFKAERAQLRQAPPSPASDLLPCDLMISSQTILEDLAREGWVQGDTLRPLGWVSTGLARLAGDPSEIWGASPAGIERDRAQAQAHLVKAFQSATQIYIPDPVKSTAGIHVKAVLTRLGLWEACAPKIQSFPNGATAMAQLAKDARAGALGCTQKTEILFTPGVEWVEALPSDFALKTLYSVARCSEDSPQQGPSPQAQLAQAFLDHLISPELSVLRAQSGFE
jgi:molybdate transport system substrate-binding protein